MDTLDYIAKMSKIIEESFVEDPDLLWAERVQKASNQIDAEDE